jgi:ferredoxin
MKLLYIFLLSICIHAVLCFKKLPTAKYYGFLHLNMFGKKNVDSELVDILFLPENMMVKGKVGTSLSEIAESAGIEIKYKCRKGECGTCEVNLDGKWIKACQTSLPRPTMGNTLKITVKPVLAKEQKDSPKFFSPKSFADGFVNNALGLVGFAKAVIDADEEFNARMKREAELAKKVAEAKNLKKQ